MNKKPLTLVVIAMILMTVRTQATDRPFLSPLFCDNMILQRDQADPIWGWTTPGQHVTVTIGDKTATACADNNGKWVARIEVPPVGGPYEVTVAGPEKVTLHNVLVGDVWVCSGQSNMEFGMGQTDDSTVEVSKANQSKIRLFLEGKRVDLNPSEEIKGEWKICSPTTILEGGWKGFSAVAYFFGKDLQQRLDIPIGLVECAWGATPGEAWTGAEGIAKSVPDFAESLHQIKQVDEQMKAGTYSRQKLLDEWYAQVAIDPIISTTSYNATDWRIMHNLPRPYESAGDPELNKFFGALLFRKEIILPDSVAGKAAVLNFGCIDDQDVTWVNGTRVGATQNLSPRQYKIASGVLKPGVNVIVTWLLNSNGPGGITGKPEDLKLDVDGSASVPLGGDWQYKISTPLNQIPPCLSRIYNNPGFPTEIFNGMVAPLAPFGIKGVIWYQGEANVGRAKQYKKILPALIESWRNQWGQGLFPFLIVQLPNFGGGPGKEPSESALAELREAQALTARQVPRVGLVTTIDIGEPGNLHPPHKKEVGHRLALLAQAAVYGQSIPFSGPVFNSVKQEKDSLRISFDHADGLLAADGGAITGFAVAGKDGVYHWATATIQGNDVIVSSPEVPVPVKARYDWNDCPKGNLFNKYRLPTTPFRTDPDEDSSGTP